MKIRQANKILATAGRHRKGTVKKAAARNLKANLHWVRRVYYAPGKIFRHGECLISFFCG
jgi:hypothetical protein